MINIYRCSLVKEGAIYASVKDPDQAGQLFLDLIGDASEEYFYMAALNAAGAYDVFFRTEKPYYVGLADGETWISEKKDRKSCIGSKKPEFVNLDKCFPDPCDAVQVRPTAYKYTASGTTCDVFASEEFVTCINSEFVAAFSEIYGYNFKSSGRIRPLVWGDCEAITLPVNVSIPEEMESALINSVW